MTTDQAWAEVTASNITAMAKGCTGPLAMGLAAGMARQGLHDLTPSWSMDTDRMHDPFDDPETREAARRFLGMLFRELKAHQHAKRDEYAARLAAAEAAGLPRQEIGGPT